MINEEIQTEKLKNDLMMYKKRLDSETKQSIYNSINDINKYRLQIRSKIERRKLEWTKSERDLENDLEKDRT